MRRLFIIIFSCLFAINISAQQTNTMTDDQVMQTIVKLHDEGASQSKIVTTLMQKGVDIQQIRRVRQNYERQISEKGMDGAADAATAKAEKVMKGVVKGQQTNVGSVKETADEEVEDMEEAGPETTKRKAVRGESLFNGNKVFGRDVFNNGSLTFEPSLNIATPQSYVVGPGDKVKLDIYGASQKSEEYTVSPDGDITIPGYGPVTISGLSVSAAQARLRSTLGSRYTSSSIKLSLGKARSISVNVMGEVKTPGTYTFSAFATVFHALYMAGGVSEIGTLRNIKVYRAGKLISVVDVYDYILNGQMKGNVRLADGDVILVGPYDCMVTISGKVKRPMYYEMKKTESVGTLLKYAGGYTADAYTKSLRVNRKDGNKLTVFNVNEFDMSSFKVSDGDDVAAEGILTRYENMVEIKGAVFRPGQYQLGGNITTVRGLIEEAAGITEDAFTAHAVLHRMNPDRTLRVISVNVQGILDGTEPDLPLQNEDALFIPTQADKQINRTITIHGEVMNPGVYNYADNETLEDFILQAGGLRETASTVKVDVARRIYDSKAVTTDSLLAKTYSFALREGFVIQGEQGFVLQPYDEVYVRRSPGYMTQQNIYVEGEVNFPGTYVLNKREYRLSDLIKAAGGTNATAYVKGARLERTINDDERVRMNKVLEMAKENEKEDSVDLAKLDLGNVYYIGIQLDKAIAAPGGDFDLVLREGDKLVVPEYTNTVKISGNVFYPNTVAYKKGMKAKYYINQAGGYGTRAKKSHAYIVHMNGTVNQVGKGEKPTPGCEIIVPTKPKFESAKVAMWMSMGTSSAALATAVATLANLLK